MRYIKALFCFATVIGLASLASASLTLFQSYNGNVGLSTDGCGSITQVCPITANVPTGATVLAAYLYSSTFGPVTPGGTLNGQTVNYSTALGVDIGYLEAFRADVTSIVAPVIDGGPGGVYNFTVTETNSGQDGEGLVVVYSDPSLPTQSVGILDGFSASGGDSFAINFSSPLNPTQPGFVADMRLGDGFSCCGQASTVTVNGTTITTNAGNNDDSIDAYPANGNLITVGGWNDPYSPFLPTYAQDHEHYNLAPYIATGDTSIHVTTYNQSQDDNIFLATFLVSGNAGFNGPPPHAPEPASILLVGGGLAGLVWRRKRTRR
jgi:hypothetical protein